jgi:hypothetical protein
MAVSLRTEEEAKQFSWVAGSFPLPPGTGTQDLSHFEVQERTELFREFPHLAYRLEYKEGRVHVYVRLEDYKRSVSAPRPLFRINPFSLVCLMAGFGAICYLAARFYFQASSETVWTWTWYGMLFGCLAFFFECVRLGWWARRRG